MEPLDDASGQYDVERRVLHAQRADFRISELQISPRQSVPWHYHRFVDDTFYVLEGRIRLSLREPEEEVVLGPGATRTVRRLRPHTVTNAGDESATFLVLQGIGKYDYVAVEEASRPHVNESGNVHVPSCDDDRGE